MDAAGLTPEGFLDLLRGDKDNMGEGGDEFMGMVEQFRE
jgi:hypothetical protein